MSIKAKLEALVYAAEEPITLDQMAALLKDDLLALKDLPAAEPHPEQADEHLGPVEIESSAEVSSMEVSSTEVSSTEDIASSSADNAAAETSRSTARKSKEKSEKVELRNLLKPFLEELIAQFESEEHGIEIRQVAGGYRMSTKPEHHDVVRAFSKSLKPPIRLSLQSLETLAVIAYKQP